MVLFSKKKLKEFLNISVNVVLATTYLSYIVCHFLKMLSALSFTKNIDKVLHDRSDYNGYNVPAIRPM